MLEQVWVFDTVTFQGTIKKEVLADIQRIWSDYEYGNDHAYHQFDAFDDCDGYGHAEEYPNLAEEVKRLLQEQCLPKETVVLIHYWW